MKKTFSFLVALTMLLSTFIQSISVNAAFSDVAEDSRYKTAINTLTTLKVINGYEDGTFKPDQSITRAEFTKLIVYMLGYGHFSAPITQFNDVADTHWANANIKTAYDLGIVNGFDEVTFKPDAPVTYEQALKMVVCTLGYQTFAEGKGGYPLGYRDQASSLKLTDGISGVGYEENATRGVVAQVMYNALEVKMYEQVGLEWEITEKNILNDYLKVYQLKGTVVGVEDSTTAACTETLYDGQMAIEDSKTGNLFVMDFTEYTNDMTVLTKLLGQTVVSYYRADLDSSDKWLVDIDSESVKNDEITVSSYELGSYSNRTLKYLPEKSPREKSVKFDKDDFSVRYNGQAVTEDVELGGTYYTPEEALSEWLDADSEYKIYGTARLVDNGADGSFNVIDIYDYETIIAVKAPSTADYKITDKVNATRTLTLDPNSNQYKYTITKNGNKVETTSIATNDVINYATSLNADNTVITAYVTPASSGSVKGTITSISTADADNATISIDNTEYNVSEGFLEYIANKEQKTLTTGITITAYKDMFGTLQWGTVASSDNYYPYAYVIDVASEGEDQYLKLFAPSNTSIKSLTGTTAYKVKTFGIASNVKLNGSRSNPDAVISELKQTAEYANPDNEISGVTVKGDTYTQLIRVGFNGSGDISEVITLANDGEALIEGEKNLDSSKIALYKGINPESKYYVTNSAIKESSSGSQLYSIKTSTPLFVIPADRTDTESYAIKNAVSTTSMSNPSSHYVEAYDLNDSKQPNCLIVYATNFKSGTQITYATIHRLVDEIKEEYDSEEDSVVNKLYSFNSTTSVSSSRIDDKASSKFDDVEMGDIVLVGLNGDNELNDVRVVLDFDDIKEVLKGEIDSETEEKYNWEATQEQTEDNYWQLYKFDWRYPKANASAGDNYWMTGGNTTGIHSRAAIFNVMQVIEDEKKFFLMPNGFKEDGTYDEDKYFEVKYSDSTKIVRYDSVEDEFTQYADDGTTALTAADIKDALIYGENCSKIMVTYISSSTSSTAVPTAKFIVIYQ